MSFIAIDLGTSFIKGAVLDLDGLRIEHVVRQPFPDPIPGTPPLHSEIDPSAIMTAARQLLAELLALAPDCEGVVTCNQMSSLVLTDQGARPLSNCIGWRDQRVLESHPAGGSYLDAMGSLVGPAARLRTGNEWRPGIPVSFLYWMAQQGALPKPAVPADLGGFVLANLCESTPLIEATNGSAHGALDIQRHQWDGETIDGLGLGELRWPELRGFGDVVGYLDVNGRRVPCYAPVGDQQCALAGTFVKTGELWLNVSTGSQVSLLTPEFEFGEAYRTRPSVDGRPYKTITHIPAGRSLSKLVELLTELAEAEGLRPKDPWSHIVRASEEVGETDLRVNLAFYLGPCGDRGEIANVREDNLTVGHLFRAAFDNMADNYLDCALRLSPERSWESLVFSGGLAQKIDLLRRLVAQRFGVPFRTAASQEDTLLGLLAMALVFGGQASSLDEAQLTVASGWRVP